MMNSLCSASVKAFARVALLALGVAALSVRGADASTLQVGGTYPSMNIIYLPEGPNAFTSGAGSINTSYLDGVQLPFLYCVDIATNINVNTTYNPTDVTTDGKIRGSYVGGSATSAGQVAWLVNHYGLAAVSQDQQAGLQAAIWKTEYGTDFTLTANNSATTINFYNTALAALGNNVDPLDSVRWLSPWYDGNRTVPAQGLVTAAAVPEPATLASAFVGFGILGLAGRRASRRRGV